MTGGRCWPPPVHPAPPRLAGLRWTGWPGRGYGNLNYTPGQALRLTETFPTRVS